MDQAFMKEKKILPLVISMSLPMVISMCVNSLYNIVDSFFVAKLSEDAMTALSLVFPVQNFVNSVAVGFGIGINAVMAIRLGGGDRENSDKAASQGVMLSILHGIILTFVCIFGMPLFLSLFTDNENIINMAVEYSNTAFLFSVIINVEIAFEKIVQAVGKMKVSMFSLICGCITNIVLDPIFIFGVGFIPSMGMKGAALATGIGQIVTLIIYVSYYKLNELPFKIDFKYRHFEKKFLSRIYCIGIPATLNMALPSFLISALNGILSAFSESYVLVLGVYYKLQTFIYLSANGIVQGIRPLVGYNFGAGEHKRVRKIFNTALALSAVIMAVGTVLSWTMPDKLFSLFTTNAETVKIGVNALHAISIGFIVSAVSVTASGALEGLGKGMPSLIISLLRYIIVIIPLAFVLSRFLGADGVWYSFAATEFITAAAAYIIYLRSE